MLYNKLSDTVVSQKIIIVRCDINVPMKHGIIQDDTRIKAILPTIYYLINNNAKVVLISHLGRPKGYDKNHSLEQLVEPLSQLINKNIHFIKDCIGQEVKNAIDAINYGEVILLENLRFYKEEENNDIEFAKSLASLGNIYVNEAFSCSHREHASIVGISKFLKSVAGFALEKEIFALDSIMNNPKQPIIAIIGGSKVSSKLSLLKNLLKKMNKIVIGGAMANTFLYAQGYQIGNSLYEKELKDEAKAILAEATQSNCEIILPRDVVVCKELKKRAPYKINSIDSVEESDIIADIGPKTVVDICNIIYKSRTILWNGPVGAFEIEPFDFATNFLTRFIAIRTKEKEISSIIGGGDSVCAINFNGLFDEFSYVSTAGGAFLEWLEGKKLPGIVVLEK